MRDTIGADHFFIFGMTTEEVAARRAAGYDPAALCATLPELQRALDMIGGGAFSPNAPDRFRCIADALLHGGDPFFVVADYASYMACQERVDALYRERDEWDRKAILNVAGMGAFSSDRSVSDYARQVWDARPVTP
jgi:starch phosphorylase